MYEEQARINAMISYFFLGPIFLLARSGSPLADPYVRMHAKRSSITLFFGLIVYIGYVFLKPLLIWNIASISLASLILGSIVGILVGYLIYSAYHAYHGDTLSGAGLASSTPSDFFQKDTIERTDAEKIRIIASYIPLLGIWLSSTYDEARINLGRKIGTCALLLIISSSLFLDGSTGLSLILILLTIILIVFSGVSFFTLGSLPIFGIYDWIPSYREFESHLGALRGWLGGFFRVLGGSEQTKSYRAIYEEHLANSITLPYTQTFPISPRIVGIPFLNLITIPFLFQGRYNEYRDNILEGITLTVAFAVVWFFFGFQSGLEAYLLIPLITLISFAPLSQNVRAPGVSIVLTLIHLFSRSKAKIETIKSREETISYSYTDNNPEA